MGENKKFVVFLHADPVAIFDEREKAEGFCAAYQKTGSYTIEEIIHNPDFSEVIYLVASDSGAFKIWPVSYRRRDQINIIKSYSPGPTKEVHVMASNEVDALIKAKRIFEEKIDVS